MGILRQLQGQQALVRHLSNLRFLRALTSSAVIQAPSSDAPFSFTPPGQNHLFVPGPVNIHQDVSRAMLKPGQNHRDPWFSQFMIQVVDQTKMVFGTTKAKTFVIPGTGTIGWEAALSNTLSPGDRVLTFRFGQFSTLWIDMMQRMGLDVQNIEIPWGEGIEESLIEEYLKKDTNKQIKAVCVVHNETTTGVTNNIELIRKAMDNASHPALLMVDGISSIGAVEFKVDDWKVDIAITGSQKALSMPTGLVLVCASEKALSMQSTAKFPRVYYDFRDYDKTNSTGHVPYTPALHLLYGLEASLKLLREEGMQNVFARHARLAEGTRRAVAGWGLESLCKNPRWWSNSLTVVEVPPHVDSNKIVQTAFAKYNLSLGVGLSSVNGKVFRIGHLGNMDELMLSGALCGVEMTLKDCGLDITPGVGVGKAIDYWQQTSKVIPTREGVIQG